MQISSKKKGLKLWKMTYHCVKEAKIKMVHDAYLYLFGGTI